MTNQEGRGHHISSGEDAFEIRCFRGLTLLELLRFYAQTYVKLAKDLQDLQFTLYIDECEANHSGNPIRPLHPNEKAWAVDILLRTKSGCEHIGLTVCSIHAAELHQKAIESRVGSDQVKALHENIERELSSHFFVGVAENRKALYCDSLRGWDEVIAKFPTATEDIEEMNKSFALCRYSASVFHSLMIVEHGLVALGKLLGVTDPKEGWDASCKALKRIVDAGHTGNQTELPFDFLEQLNVCVQAMKLAWRNKVNHATGKIVVMGGGFAPYVAEEIISATRGFMRRLAEGMP